MLTLSNLERANFRHLYTEIFWYGIFFGTSLTFWGVYAARLGATPFQIGLLSSGPGLVNLIISLPAVLLLETGYPERGTFISSIFNRVLFTLLIFLPFLRSSELQIWLIVVIAFISALPGTILTMSANLMLAEVVPVDWRATVIGRRSALLSVSITGSILFSGLIFDKVVFPQSYQIIFGIGMIGAAVSSYHLSRVISERRFHAEGNFQFLKKTIRSWIKNSIEYLQVGWQKIFKTKIEKLLRMDLLKGSFGTFIISYLIFYTICAFPIPIYILFLVQTIKVSDFVISIGNSIFYTAMILFSLLLARLSWLLGHHKVLVISGFLYILYPTVGGFAQDPLLFYIASFFGGAAWGLANGALINRLFERAPENDRPASMAFHNLALNLGTLVGVLIGSILPNYFGLRDALILSGGLRSVGGLILLFWG